MPSFMLLAAALQSAQAAPAEPGVGGYQSAGNLYDMCAGSSVHAQEYCFAYIAAVSDAVRAYQEWLNLRDLCVPANTSQGRLRDIFVEYTGRNPSAVRDQAASIVVLALQDSFPCTGAAAVEQG